MSGLAALYGVSIHLFHESRLSRDHLVHIAAHGFEAVEVFATRSHFDYHDDRAIAELSGWLTDTRLALHSMHAPIFDGMKAGRSARSRTRRPMSRGAPPRSRKRRQRCRWRGTSLTSSSWCTSGCRRPNRCRRATTSRTRRSVEDLVALAADVHVRVALEVIPNPLSSSRGARPADRGRSRRGRRRRLPGLRPRLPHGRSG